MNTKAFGYMQSRTRRTFDLATQHVACALLAICLVGCASGSGVKGGWNVRDAMQAPDDPVPLLGKDNKTVVAEISRARLQMIADTERRIQEAANVRVELLIVHAKEANAFAWRKDEVNYVAITLPMLKLLKRDQDQYAALFGHEVGHIVKNHADANKQRATVLNVLQIAGRVALSAVGAPFGSGYALGIGASTVNAKFSRDQEREADAVSVAYLYEAGFDPQGAIRLHRNLLQGKTHTSLPFLRNHPSGEERIEAIQALIDEHRRESPRSSNPDTSTRR
jgi:predicted Zn-dependent protease